VTPLTLDHIVIAVRELGAATENYRRLLGRAPSWKGRHPTYGTANVLFRLDNSFVELLAPVEGSGVSVWHRALVDHLDAKGEGLYAIALGTDDVDAAVSSARESGLDVRDPAAGDGVDEQTGAGREWSNALIAPEATRGIRAFFIEHGSPADALPPAPAAADGGTLVTAVDHTVLVSSNLKATLALWHDTLGLDLRLTLDRGKGRRLHFLRLGDSILELAGEAEPERPGERDLLYGVAYRVGNVDHTVERLRADGVTVSDPRPGNAPGTVVADLKPGFSHDVRTIFIQKDVA